MDIDYDYQPSYEQTPQPAGLLDTQTTLIAILALPIILITSYLYTVSTATARFPHLRNKKICLLIAHPDDEAMFFAPTLLALTEPSLGNHVKILCLSSGNADGLGEVRKKELIKSGLLLGLRNEDDIFIVESPDYQDSMTNTWEASKISTLLASAFAPSLSKPSPSPALNTPTHSKAPTATIDVLLTFDGEGISSHPNHISLYHGARKFVGALMKHHPGWSCPVSLYTLSTTNAVRKYMGIFDSIFSLGSMASEIFGGKGVKKGSDGEISPKRLLFMNGVVEANTAQKAMTTAHVSQMKWFRYGWIYLSRYMYINDLVLEKVS